MYVPESEYPLISRGRGATLDLFIWGCSPQMPDPLSINVLNFNPKGTPFHILMAEKLPLFVCQSIIGCTPSPLRHILYGMHGHRNFALAVKDLSMNVKNFGYCNDANANISLVGVSRTARGDNSGTALSFTTHNDNTVLEKAKEQLSKEIGKTVCELNKLYILPLVTPNSRGPIACIASRYAQIHISSQKRYVCEYKQRKRLALVLSNHNIAHTKRFGYVDNAACALKVKVLTW